MHILKKINHLSRLVMIAITALFLSAGMILFAKPVHVMAATSISDKTGLENFITQNGGTYISPDDSTVKLTSDLTCSDYLITYLTQDLTLDLNNHSILFEKANGFSVRGSGADNLAVFRITNSGEDISKAIISTSGQYPNTQEITTLNVAGALELSDITIANQATGGSGNPMAIQQSVKGSDLKITDCTVTSTGSCYYMLYGNAAFHNCSAISSGKYATVLLENQGTLTLDDGTYSQTVSAPAVKVNGGAIEGDATLSIECGTYQGAPALDISGERAVTSIACGTFISTSSEIEPIQLTNNAPEIKWGFDSTKYELAKNGSTWKIASKPKNPADNSNDKPPKPSTPLKPSTPAKPKVVSTKPKIAKLTPKKKSLSVKFAKKPSGYYGKAYQVAYRVKGTKKWKTITTGKQIKTLKSLKKGKKYQVRVRAYKKVSKKTYFSKWSSIKTSGKIK